MKFSSLHAVVLAALAAVGWFAGRAMRPPAVVLPGTPPEEAVRPVPPVLTNSADAPSNNAALAARWNFALKAAGAEAPELRMLLEELAAVTDVAERQQREQLLALRWGELRPVEDMEKFIAADNPFMMTLFDGWLERDPAGATHWILTTNHPEFKPAGLGADAMLMTAAKASPDRFLDEMLKRTTFASKDIPPVNKAFDLMTRIDPQHAVARLDQLQERALRIGAIEAIARQWANNNYQEAAAWARHLENPKERATALQAAVGTLARTDPRKAMTELNGVDPGQHPEGAVPHPQIAASLAQTDAKAAADWVKSLDPARFNQEELLAEQVLPALEAATPAALVELFKGVVVEGRQHDFSETVNVPPGMVRSLLRWQPQNAGAALDEVRGLPSSEARDCMANYLAWRCAQQDPAAALARAQGADGWERERLAAHAAAAFANSGEVEKLSAAIALNSDPTDAGLAARTQAVTLAKNHPELGAEFLSRLPEVHRAAAAAQFAQDLVQRDPQAALALAGGLPQEVQADYQAIVASRWAVLNPVAAQHWAAGVPAGPQHDAAAAGLASGLMKKDPASAFRWAGVISDPERKVNHLRSIFNEWRFQDSVGAFAAARRLGLSAEQLQTVLTPPPDENPNPEARPLQ
ncbi:MAG: hypothetical protein KA004_01930 [Verrucomicrobiales bacterium]|nr:hypothetical protein [Verrucomicrobiales bacterium]